MDFKKKVIEALAAGGLLIGCASPDKPEPYATLSISLYQVPEGRGYVILPLTRQALKGLSELYEIDEGIVRNGERVMAGGGSVSEEGGTVSGGGGIVSGGGGTVKGDRGTLHFPDRPCEGAYIIIPFDEEFGEALKYFDYGRAASKTAPAAAGESTEGWDLSLGHM